MNNVHYYDTINECEKAVVSKAIEIDIKSSSNAILIESFIHTIKIIFLYFSTAIFFAGWIFYSFKMAAVAFILSFILYIIGLLIVAQVKAKFVSSCSTMKINTIRNMIDNCKELCESEQPEWQKRQIMKRIANKANLDIIWDKDK